tara:strand:- start:449 stop:652 length:204 start_codon:yes stop_codon:yes gene_type:complete
MNYLINMAKNKLEIKQIKSAIGYNFKVKRTLEALGIRSMNSKVVHNDTPAIRGMINKIQHILEVKEL